MSNIADILDTYQVDAAWQRRLYEELHANPELSMHEE